MSTNIQIIRSTDPISVEHPIFHIFGGPGLGKTSLAFSAPKPLLLNCDNESALARAVNRRDSINVLTIDVLAAIIADPQSVFASFDTIAIDPVGGFVDLLGALLINENAKLGRSDGNLTQQGYGALKTSFKSFMVSVKALGKNIFFVSHNKEDKAANDVVYNRPDITGGSKDIVMRWSDFVGFLRMDGKQRIIDFNPNEAYFAKNPRGLWKPWKVPPPEKAADFMTKLFNEGRAELSKLSESSASIAEQLEQWRARISAATTAEQLNRILAEYRGLPPVLEPQVRAILRKRAEVLALDYDTTTKLFLEPETQPAGGVL
jgi:hypothetical protein